jgi:hypothetical protein
LYGIPKDTDLSFLIGREVEQVCIGVFQVQFHFDQDVSIFVTGSFRYIDESGSAYEWLPKNHNLAARTANLLGLFVTDLTAEPSGTLTLAFSNAAKLIIFDDSKQYESYEIRKPGLTIVV